MILFIDTHLNDVVVILENNGEFVKETILKDVKQNSTVIMPTIKEMIYCCVRGQ